MAISVEVEFVRSTFDASSMFDIAQSGFGIQSLFFETDLKDNQLFHDVLDQSLFDQFIDEVLTEIDRFAHFEH